MYTHKQRRMRSRRGFTLLELLVVMFILVMLAGAVTLLVTKHAEDAKHVKAESEITVLKSAIETYRLKIGEYPPNLDALRNQPSGVDKWTEPFIDRAIINDPWGNPYGYLVPGEKNKQSYDLYTYGKDGKEGGSGNDADVVNWDVAASQ